MDTKLKKSHKWKIKNLIIALVVLLPAALLVGLYPTMEKAANERKQLWEKEVENQPQEYPEQYVISSRALVNYAVEASYYLYSQMLQEATGQQSNIEILEYYGWLNDYDVIDSQTQFYAEYQTAFGELPAEEAAEAQDGIYTRTNASVSGLEGMFDKANAQQQWEQYRDDGKASAFLVIEYDEYGNLTNIDLYADNYTGENLRDSAKSSKIQYLNNLEYYAQEMGLEENLEFVSSAQEIQPKNFRAVFMVDAGLEGNTFSEYYGAGWGYAPMFSMIECYFDIGAFWIVLACAGFVALMALVLPFFKKLETGREKIFSLPLEAVCLLIWGGVCGALGMCYVMPATSLSGIRELIALDENLFVLLGYHFGGEQVYAAALALNFLAWALLFFAEYMCVAQLRQFFCGPKAYLKNRLLVVRAARWCGRQCRRFVNYVTDIDINEGLHKSIIKVVLVNFVALTVICCFWFFGIIGVVIYSVGLYVLLKKYGSRLQAQYRSILKATNQMAEGELHITLPEDLGVFSPLGSELSRVQQGFAKAVAEEAKSQNMKTELITNVSHDLKTPLTAIITYVDLLKKEDITEEERASYIHTLDLKSQRLKALIEDLFEVSKANSGNVQMNFMDVDIVNLLKEVRVEMEDKISESNLDFRWRLPEEKIILKLDGQRTYRIFENLLNNTLKYAMPFTRVYIDMAHEQGAVSVTFRNMSAQELHFDAEHLTERFVRGDSARNSEGSGLGLAIAKSFTELQSGEFRIDVDGDLFKVTIRFPEGNH